MGSRRRWAHETHRCGSDQPCICSRFGGRAAIAADAGSGRVDEGHEHFLAAIVLASASITQFSSTPLRTFLAELRGRFGADRARDGGRFVPGQEFEAAREGEGGVLAGDSQCQVCGGAEIVLMREHDAWFESAAQGLVHQCVAGCVIIRGGPPGFSDQLLEHCGDIKWCGAPRQLSFGRKLEGAQVIATFQPDGTENAVEVAESAFDGRLQMQPILGRVTSFHHQMEPAWSRFAGHGYQVVFPASLKMIGHLAFAKPPVTKAAFGRSEFVIHCPFGGTMRV